MAKRYPMTFGRACFLAMAAGLAGAEPEPLMLGDAGDRVAVVARSGGAVAAHFAGLLQECAGLDLPVQVFLTGEADGEARGAVAQSAEFFGLSPDAFDFLRGPGEELGALLSAFKPSHVALAEPDNETMAVLELAFPDPAGAPSVLLAAAEGDGKASLALELPPYQLEGRAAALSLFGLPDGGGTTECYRGMEIDELADLPPMEAEAGAPEGNPRDGDAAPAVPPEMAEEAGGDGAAGGKAMLRPRTRVPGGGGKKPSAKAKPKPAPKKDPSPSWGEWFDQPVCW